MTHTGSTIDGAISAGGGRSFLALKRRKNEMTMLLVFNRDPYDGTDVTWNGLRLAEQLLQAGSKVSVFLMNDSVDLARDVTQPSDGYFDLGGHAEGVDRQKRPGQSVRYL